MKPKKYRSIALITAFCALTLSGCAPALVGGGAVGAYKVGSDERSLGRQLDDSVLNTKVKAALVREATLESMNIDTDTLRRVVYLTGVVPDSRQANLAGHVAAQVEGVVEVVNDVQVGSLTAGQRLDDAALTSKIKTKLVEEESVRALSVDVDTVRGIVHLTGIVDRPEQTRIIMRIVDETQGVRGVKNHLVTTTLR